MEHNHESGGRAAIILELRCELIDPYKKSNTAGYRTMQAVISLLPTLAMQDYQVNFGV